MLDMKVFVIFVPCFMLVQYVYSSVRIYSAISGSIYSEEDNYIYNDYDYDAEDGPGPDTDRVSLEKFVKMIRASENVVNYPEDEIRAALERRGELKKFFESSEKDFHIGLNQNNFGTACSVTYEYSNSQSLYDVGGTKRTIVNLGEYRQRVLHGFCDESMPCQLPREALYGYNSTCKQNHMKMPLLTYEEGTIKSYQFSIDCGCACMKTKE